MKIALWRIRRGRCEASFPPSAPRQRNREYDRETVPQRTPGHYKVELGILQKRRNPLIREMQTRSIKDQQHPKFPSPALEQPARLRVFYVQMQKQGWQHAKSDGNDYDCKLIERNWRLVVINLRVQGEQLPAIEKVQREALAVENALIIVL